MTIAPLAPCAHGELDCADAETMLAEATHENGNLHQQITGLINTHVSMEHEMDLVRLERDRLRALLDDITRKQDILANERDDLAGQVKYLNEELAAVESDVVPEGTLMFAALSREEMVAEYRRASRITRGPLPPSVLAAVEAGRESIVEAMTETGRAALVAVVRREVRRRARARSTTPARRASRATGTR